MAIFDACLDANGANDTIALMQCISNLLESSPNSTDGSFDKSSTPSDTTSNGGLVVDPQDLKSWLLLLTGSMVFFMQAGFAMVCAGAIRKKNVNNTMIKNLLDACGAGIAFYMFGYAFAYGSDHEQDITSSSFIGTSNFFLAGDPSVDAAFFFFQYAFSATAVTIVAGTLAERCKMASYFCYSFWLTGFVYPVVVHTFWSNQGYFSPFNTEHVWIGMGMVDFSGSGVIHITGGSTALYAAYILGARRGRFYDRQGRPLLRPGLTKGHSVALQMLGTMLLWFCWYGFNSGSALLLTVEHTGKVAARAAVNTTLAAAAGTMSALLTNGFLVERRTGEFVLDIVYSMNGCLSGLVAVTAGCGVVHHWSALLIGIVGGWVYIAADMALIHCKIDDAVSAIPVHLANGIWGVLAVGFFAAPGPLMEAYGTSSYPGLFYASSSGGRNLFPAQLIGTLWIILWTFVTMFPFFLLLDFMGWFRVNELEELVGLDMTYGNGTADNDGEASDDEELRLAAYRQRFEERRQMRESNQPVQSMTVGELLNDSFFGAAQAMAAKMEPGPSLDNLVPDTVEMAAPSRPRPAPSELANL